jgi:hypothetical protein
VISEGTHVKLATFIDPLRGMTPRLGIAIDQGIIDVRAAAEALHRAAPADSLKGAITSGPEMLAALASLKEEVSGHNLVQPSGHCGFFLRFRMRENFSASARIRGSTGKNWSPIRC